WLPTHVPGDQRALAGVALDSPEDRGSDGLIRIGDLLNRRAVPDRKIIPGPGQRLVQVTEITGVGPPRLQRGFNTRVADLMTAQGSHQAVARIGHMAIVTKTSART